MTRAILSLLALSLAAPACFSEPEITRIGSGRGVLVLAHGFGADADLGFSATIGDALAEDGYRVFKTEVPSIAPVAMRAESLADQVDDILEVTGADRIHLIGHSMGGLDSRYLISSLGYGDRIATLTTVATPHRGSPLADAALGDNSGGEGSGLALIQSLFGGDPEEDELSRLAVIDLSEANAPAFNAANPDSAEVRYISWGGLATVAGLGNPNAADACRADGVTTPDPDSLGAMFVPTAAVVSRGDERAPHDGLVPVDSARWGSFRGCVAADHFDEVGFALSSEFDVVAFYRQIATEVAP